MDLDEGPSPISVITSNFLASFDLLNDVHQPTWADNLVLVKFGFSSALSVPSFFGVLVLDLVLKNFK